MTEAGSAEEELANVSGNDDVEKGAPTEGAMEGESCNRDITEVTSQSYGSKVSDSCTGACFGFFLFFASIALLIWNEGRTVKQQKDIDEGREMIIELDLNNYTNTSIPTSFESHLVHAIGDLGTSEVLIDPIFGVSNVDSNITSNASKLSSENILKLMRSVEMYQWKESSSTTSHKRLDGSTYQETTYSYSKVWSSSVIDSSIFREKSSTRTNPGSLPFEPETLIADPIYLGNRLQLEDSVVSSLNWYDPFDTIALEDVPDATLRSQLSIYSSNGFFYRSNLTSDSSASSLNNPSVGDARITFDVVLPDTISIIAKLNPAATGGGSGLGPYTTKRGGSLLLIERGVYTAEEMFIQAENDNTTTAWILRFVGFFIMVISILLILQPLATVVDIIPFVGDCIQSTMEGFLFPCIALLIAIPTSLFVISLAWLAYRPNIAIPIAVGTFLIVIFLFVRVRKSKLHQHQTNDTAADSSFLPEKPQEFNSNNNNDVTLNAPYSAAASPFNTQDHNVNYYNTVAGAEKINDNNGFAEALDHPVPQWESDNNPADIKQGNTAIEEDVVFK